MPHINAVMDERVPCWLSATDQEFPDVNLALREPDGLLALGGDLRPERLLEAYRSGIFPWYDEGQPILWWSPDPRAVLFPAQVKISRSLAKVLRQARYSVTLDRAFREVMLGCAAPRNGVAGTWITDAMIEAYTELHIQGHAHSVEVWKADQLIGGLYGVALGKVFFGESMFSRSADASKVALVHLARQLESWGYGLIDCQVYNDHLASLGAELIPRSEFISLLSRWIDPPGSGDRWQRHG